LQPVTWKNGWPSIGKDIDGDGIGEPIWIHNKPIKSKAVFQLQTSDEFDAPRLGPQWNWNHEPRRERFSLSARPGYLRLIASKPSTLDRGKLKGAFWGASNTPSQRHLGVTKTTATTKFDLSGMTWGTRTGLCHHSGRYALFGALKQKDGAVQLFFNHNGKFESGPTVTGTDLYLRSTTDGDQADFSWSVDGESWNTTPWLYTLNFGNWRGNRPGVFCWNNRTDNASESGFVDIDWFRYESGTDGT
jgi:beta-xylosidase